LAEALMDSTLDFPVVEVASRKTSSSRWKTFSRKDPEFLSYLDGSFSDDQLALPVRSLNVETAVEQVTFEIVPVSSIEMPSRLHVLTTLLRPQSLLLSIGPMLAILVRCFSRGFPVNIGLALSCFIGVLAFHSSMNLFNDYNDHIRGRDRLRPHGGSRVIQNGWIRAIAVKHGAWGLLGLAVLCGLPALFLSPVLIVAALALLFGLEFAFQIVRLKARGWAEVWAFALMGPLLTSGYAWAIDGRVDASVVALGCVFGAISLLYFHSANFENIFPDGQAGVRTWATRTGFDASKKFYLFVATLSLFSSAAYALYFERDWRLLAIVIVQVLVLVPAILRVHRLASPLSSELRGLRIEAVRLSAWTTLVIVVTEFIIFKFFHS
jgi:1,4-dihydroxy-2-naphthoate octaprenyltransferase